MRKMNLSRAALLTGGAMLVTALTACAPHHPPPPAYPSGYQQGAGYPVQAPAGTEYGQVSHIELLQAQQRGQTSGAGAVIGAVVGGVLGNQVGKGSGRAAATAVGVVGGAVAGNAIEERNNSGYGTVYRISIRLDRGGYRAYDVNSVGDLRVGDRVRLYNGQITRY